jgi:hypothetical protein
MATIDTAIALALQQFKVDRLKAEQKSNFTSSSVRRGLCSCATDRIWETGVIYPELTSHPCLFVPKLSYIQNSFSICFFILHYFRCVAYMKIIM